jgi:hypothetical protein
VHRHLEAVEFGDVAGRAQPLRQAVVEVVDLVKHRVGPERLVDEVFLAGDQVRVERLFKEPAVEHVGAEQPRRAHVARLGDQPVALAAQPRRRGHLLLDPAQQFDLEGVGGEGEFARAARLGARLVNPAPDRQEVGGVALATNPLDKAVLAVVGVLLVAANARVAAVFDETVAPSVPLVAPHLTVAAYNLAGDRTGHRLEVTGQGRDRGVH